MTWPVTGQEAHPLGASPITNLVGMTVNTSYRVEQRGSNQARVILLDRGTPGIVPWDQIHSGMVALGKGPLLIDLVVSPTL